MSVLQDLRLGVRMLLKQPGFTALAVATLALGIGANTVIFSVVNAVLLRALPFSEPGRLVTLWERNPEQGYEENAVSPPNFVEWRQQSRAFERLSAFTFDASLNLSGGERPEPVHATRVTADLFATLGVEPLLGRAFLPEEEQPGRDAVAILGYGLWTRQFGADPGIVGRAVLADGRSVTVVGVMPRGFDFPGGTGVILDSFTNPAADLWIPLALDQRDLAQRSNHWLQVIGRLGPGVTLERAGSEMNAIEQGIEQRNPKDYVGSHVKVVSLAAQVVSGVRPALLVLLGAVSFVLLMACGNVANLLLVRATARQHEITIRAALGASRGMLVRQMLVESLLLAGCGGAAGMLLALWGLDVLAAVIPGSIPRSGDIGVDGHVLVFTTAVSVLAALLFGLAPALHAVRGNLSETLRAGSRGSAGGGPHRVRLRSFLVVSEIALALVLLVGAALMIQSFARLRHVSPGFDPHDVLTMRLSLPRVRYPDGADRSVFVQRLVEEVRSLPGVQSAGVVTHLPLAGGSMNFALGVEGYTPPDPRKSLSAEYRAVSPGYFGALGIRLTQGRPFTEQDTGQAPHVVIVNEALVRRIFGNQDPLGRTLTMGFDNWTGRIVGVIRDVRHTALDAQVLDEVYGPYTQTPFWPFMTLAIRTQGDPLSLAGPVRDKLMGIDSQQAVAQVRTLEQVLAESVAQPRFRTGLLSLFGLLALALAAVGIYGVMSCTVTERTRDIGVRMALGARSGDVLRLIVGQGMRLTAIGMALGLAGAFGLARVLEGLLFGTSATDAKTFLWVALGLAAVALTACWLPARRATKVDPVVALRYE